MNWGDTWYKVGADFNGSPETSFVKFDPTSRKLTISGSIEPKDDMAANPDTFFFRMCVGTNECSTFNLEYTIDCAQQVTQNTPST